MTRPPRDRVFFLRRSNDIERVKQTGRRLQTPLFNLVSCTSELPYARFGIVVGKRFGGAVARNRAKRVFRELARQVREHVVQRQDLLVFPRREALRVKHRTLHDAWTSALRHEGLLTSGSGLRCDHSASV